MEKDVILVSSNYVPGYRVTEILGQVMGMESASRGLGGNIAAGLKTIVGGEVKQYTELTETVRRTTIERLREEAKRLGADAVISINFDSASSADVQGSSALGIIPLVGPWIRLAASASSSDIIQLITYGTAVRLEKLKDEKRYVEYG